MANDETIDTVKRQIHVVGTYMPKLKKVVRGCIAKLVYT